MSDTAFSTSQEFTHRHIGLTPYSEKEMLSELGFSDLERMAQNVIPKNIRTSSPFQLGPGSSESETLHTLKKMMSQNQVFRSYIGLGYHGTLTPSVIQRNILENPLWYTSYTPYQPEISQGRLESLLNFQTMVCDLTGMEIANASLLDEGTAAAEAMSMAHGLVKNKSDLFYVSHKLHPHVIEVLKTRSEPLGLKMKVVDTTTEELKEPHFAVILSYPHTDGGLHNYKSLLQKTQNQGGLGLVATDLLALTLLTPPGEWGADIVFGNSQRFGVPFGFGGPHAAFLATRDSNKRLLPGRLIGVSVDANGKKALRLTLQTREQHIRREKATSNICTAQALLANMAAMYAVYHGPEGLKKIARRVHGMTQILAKTLLNNGFQIESHHFFDTVTLKTEKAFQILSAAQKLKINFQYINKDVLTVSLDETVTFEDLRDVVQSFGVNVSVEELQKLSQDKTNWGDEFLRKSDFLTHPTFNRYHSETELLRYITTLQNKDISLAHSMIPLGSCTMKLNATTELMPLSWPEVNNIHPFAPLSQAKGYLTLFKEIEKQLCDITGFAAVSLQPNAGSQGEYAGLLVIRKYHQSRNEGHRNICLIPTSAHGTNPASAVMAGMTVVLVKCDDQGNVDVSDLREKAELHKNNLSALMVTYPSTHGVFEEAITEICDIVHRCGGQVYMDGANLNALVGLCRPGEFGPDVSHMNLHKTFAIPHGGGGPGVGPIGVAAHLKSFIPTHSLVPESGPTTGISATTSAPWGSASILTISWSYIKMMGTEGLKRATLTSILSANYIAKKLHPHYPVLYKGKEGLVAHECIIDLRDLKKSTGIDVTDVAKRLMDFGFHAPTMSWPVAGTLMIEPTESESKAEVDRFIEAMITIRNEIKEIESGKVSPDDNVLKHAPHTAHTLTADAWDRPYSRSKAGYPLPWVSNNKFWPPVGRIDNAFGDKNVVCSCPPLEDYQ